MNANQNSSRSRPVAKKADDIRNAWNALAPEASFGGKTLADLDAEIAKFQSKLDALDEAKKAASAAVLVKNQGRSELAEFLVVISMGVQIHEEHGRDSPLYRAMGYVPLSERSNGTARPPQDPPPANEEAAA